MFNLTSNSRGFSIVQVMIAAGLMGGLSLVLLQMSQSQSDLQQSARVSLDTNELYNRIQKNFLDSEACFNTFYDIPISTDPTNPTNILVLLDSQGNTFLEVDEDATPSLKVGALKAKRVGSKNLELKVVLKKKDHVKGVGGREFGRTFTLDALFDGSNKITKCYSQLDNAVTSARKLVCDDLGATWDGSECVMDDAFKKKIVEDGLDQLNTVEVYSDGGVISFSRPVKTDKAHCCGKNCTANGSCPSGYGSLQYTTGHYKTCAGTDPTCCGLKRRMTRDYKCTYSGAPIGKLVP